MIEIDSYLRDEMPNLIRYAAVRRCSPVSDKITGVTNRTDERERDLHLIKQVTDATSACVGQIFIEEVYVKQRMERTPTERQARICKTI